MMMTHAFGIRRWPCLLLVLLVGFAVPAWGDSGLPVPRFVSLRAAEANLRTGPGVRYPVEWVYRRAGLPIQIIAEFDVWRRIRDWEGTEGWLHRSLLSGTRTVLVVDAIADLYESPATEAALIARVEPGVVGRLITCAGDWCKIDIRGYSGWIVRSGLWGVDDAD